MRVATLQLLFLLALSLPTLALNPAWIKLDKQLIAQVNALIKATPTSAERYFARNVRAGHELGFGWRSRELAAYGGYTTVYATFYYRHDSLMSYAIHPTLPDEPILQKTYLTWYAPSFRLKPARLNPVYFHKAVLSKPLAAYQQRYPVGSTSPAIDHYMSPESGVAYGYSGGEVAHLLQNRASFRNLQVNLSVDQLVRLMYATNPASRLTAIEYYLNNKNLFANRAPIEQWIETVFQELPEVESIHGCIGGKYKARDLVAEFTETN